jgi:hypothetical protein
MKPSRTKRLDSVALPAALAACLGAMLLLRGEPNALAAIQERGEYLVVAGANGRGDDHVLWILDTRAEELVAAGWDNATKTMKGFGTRDINQDLALVQQRR